MIKGGWIRLHRSLTEWEWFHDPITLQVFIYLLLSANYEDRPFGNIIVKRGETVTSYPKLSEILGISVRQARTALDHLKLTGNVTVTSYSKFSVVTVNNYDNYQPSGRQNDSQTTAKRQATRQSIDNNGRNIRKSTTYSKRNKESADAQSAFSGKVVEEPPEGVTFPEGITNMADYLKYLEE